MYEFRNPKHNNFGGIDMEINHPQFGWIPFTASPYDDVQTGVEMYNLTVGIAAPADPLPPPPVPRVISDRQFFQQMAINGLVTEAEAEDAVGSGAIPTSMMMLITQLPAEQQFPARMMIRGATSFERDHPLTILIGQLYGLTSEEIDQIWISASSL